MGQQCCTPQLQNQPYIIKALLLQQSQFQTVQNPLSQDQFINSKINNLDQKKIYKHKNQQRYYIGQWINGEAQGQGLLYLPTTILYEGQFLNGKPNGIGKMNFIQKQQYFEGQFNNGKANGKGLYQNNKKKFKFQGQWNNSKPNYGILTFQQNPNILKIQIKDYNLGIAQISYKDGRTYQGCIDQGKLMPQGQGQITFNDGSVYKGGWKNGLMHGQGIYQWKDGSKYQGSYFQGKKQGKGKFTYTSGKQYIGMWSNGKQQGEGKIITSTGQIQKNGYWKDGKFQKSLQQNLPQPDTINQNKQ